jgi:AraC-like DNA-binding protein
MEGPDPDTAKAPLVGLAVRYEAGVLPAHRHTRAQILYAVAGAMTARTDTGSWVLPPTRALWLPAGLSHALQVRRAIEMRTLYLDQSPGWTQLPATAAVFEVSPLLREMIQAVTKMPWDYAAESADARFARALCDRLHVAQEAPVHVPEPRDVRAKRLAAIFHADPSERRPLPALAAQSGASLRTLERLFVTETGMSVGAWVQQLRLMAALERLADGLAVSEAAFEVGFDNPSSFIALFRRQFGVTPARYFK